MPTTIFNFDTPSNYTYDTDKIEITASVARLKNRTPSNATFYAPYTNDLDAVWGDGIFTGTAVGGASVSGGKLDLAYGDNRYVDYDGDDNVNTAIQKGCIRFKFIPNYAGSPASSIVMFSISAADGSSVNGITLFHYSTGQLHIDMIDSAGFGILAINWPSWSASIGVEYEIEFNYDITTGATRLFIDGVQHGSTLAQTGTRSSSIDLIRIGNRYNGGFLSNFQINDIILFDEVQHITDYTPDWSNIYETVYVTDDPQVTINATFTHDAIEAFTEVSTKLLADEVKYIIEVDSVKNWWDGVSWTTSNGTYAESNTETEIAANMSSLTSVRVTSRFFAFLHSDDGLTTPELDTLSVTYNFAGSDEDSISRCAVWFYSRDGNGSVSTEPITFRIPKKLIEYKNNIILRENDIIVTPETTGYTEVNLIETENMTTIDGSDVLYEVEIDNKKYYFEVPNQENALLFDLITA